MFCSTLSNCFSLILPFTWYKFKILSRTLSTLNFAQPILCRRGKIKLVYSNFKGKKYKLIFLSKLRYIKKKYSYDLKGIDDLVSTNATFEIPGCCKVILNIAGFTKRSNVSNCTCWIRWSSKTISLFINTLNYLIWLITDPPVSRIEF